MSERQQEFDRAWKAAQEIDKVLVKHHADLALVLLLVSMRDAAEVAVEMMNDCPEENSLDLEADALFNQAITYIEDIYSRSNLSWFMEQYAEQMKQFGVRRRLTYVIDLPTSEGGNT